jgi:5-methylcytosine-specific restriction protein B
VDDEAVYAAARRILDSGLARDGSLFTPGVEIWSADAADALYAKFIQQPDLGKESFVRSSEASWSPRRPQRSNSWQS